MVPEGTTIELPINKDSFDALLEWLDPDPDKAGQQYEKIRGGLIRIFVSHGLSDAEHCVDETVDRVARRLPDIRDGYVGEQIRYFVAVARNVIREQIRRKEIPMDILPQCLPLKPGDSTMVDCLKRCLKLLPLEKQDLILDYHLYDGRDKIKHHRQMASELSITVGALRTRAHYIRVALESCILACVHPERNKTDSRGH
jgi:DNA-directed RNA polymerase specialized sigma24 family protein